MSERTLSAKRVRITRQFVCPYCKRQVDEVERHDTKHFVELFCLNDGCGVMIVQKPR